MEERVIGGFHRLLEGDSPWETGGFTLPDGTRWEYREPNAVILVRNGWLQVAAVPFTRRHDRVQILDNAKHMYFSKERFQVPEGGRITFEIEVAAQTFGTEPGNLYDGYVSWNLLDLETGWAFDFFTGGDRVATVFGRLPFPGAVLPETGEARAFCMFHELDELPTRQGQVHAYRITYDQGGGTVEFAADGQVVDRYTRIPDRIGGLTAALGLMTEIDIQDGRSVSCHGQGVIGRWSPMRVKVEG
ncbi:DUF6081 family protein [Tepidiforma sp.]|uniref:DUF6081 family protein n=1 Tax=Tepidiforma sp. TaxID=2682230 RepID=UPI002ADD7B84|nr:DUF6081 family protein [Tepidiforma sp.]